jgi:uncharacterized protein
MDSGSTGTAMTEELARKALKSYCRQHENSPASPMVVEFAGGEPLLQCNLIRTITAYGRTLNPNLRFAIQTNGTLLNESIIKFIIDNRIGLGLSLDGIPAVNDQVRGESHQVVKALKLLDHHGLGTNITVVLSRQTIDRLDELLLFCGAFSSVRVINLDIIRPLGRAENAVLIPRPEQVRRIVKRMMRTLEFVNASRRVPLKIREVEQIKRRKGQTNEKVPYCYAAEGSSIVVTPDGHLGICASLVGKQPYGAGQLGLQDNSRVEMIADRFSKIDTRCHRCDLLSVCRGGCPSRRIAYNNNSSKRCDIECLLRRELHKQI